MTRRRTHQRLGIEPDNIEENDLRLGRINHSETEEDEDEEEEEDDEDDDDDDNDDDFNVIIFDFHDSTPF
jgi:hypothetical protein